MHHYPTTNIGSILLKRKLTMLGTVRRNKRELPEFRNKEVYSTSFYFIRDTTVLNYVRKSTKVSFILVHYIQTKLLVL